MMRLLLTLLLLGLASPLLAAEPTFTLRGTVSDLAGQPVIDAEVYLYRSANTRRPADYISARTAGDGAYRLVLPAGNYWGVARIKQGERFGPLASGQRHSGDPVQIAIGEEPVTTQDFSVADLKEMAQRRQKVNHDVIVVSGWIFDGDGKPVAGAYAFARAGQVQATLPEYISAWTGPDGRFTLHLPPGDYHWGASRQFPPPILPQLVPAPANEVRGELRLIVGD